MIDKKIPIPADVVINELGKKVERWANRRPFGIAWLIVEEKRIIEISFDATPEQIERALKFLGLIFRGFTIAAVEQRAREAIEAARIEAAKHHMTDSQLLRKLLEYFYVEQTELHWGIEKARAWRTCPSILNSKNNY